MGHELLFNPHEAGLQAMVRRPAMHDGRMAEDHITGLAGKLDDAEGYALYHRLALHEGCDAVGR